MRPSTDEPVKPMSNAGCTIGRQPVIRPRFLRVEHTRVGSRLLYVTENGLDRLLRQLSVLITSKRPELVAGIREAGRSDTAEDQKLEAITDELTIVDGLIRRLRELIRDALVIDFGPGPDGTVSVGARVRLQTGSGQKAFRIVGWLEADPRIGLISNESPLGEALLRRGPGDQIEWTSPDGTKVATVLSVESSSGDWGGSPAREGSSGTVNQGPSPLDRLSASSDDMAMVGSVSHSHAQTRGARSTNDTEVQK